MGLESVVKQELTELGYHDARAVGASGRVELKGDSEAIARCNIHLRSATRVMLVLARFPATTFDELFDSTTAVPWKDYIHAGASFPVRGKSVGSTLHSVPACQSIVKKAIIAKLLATGSGANFAPDTDGWVQEDARKGIFGVEVSIQKDEVTISLDTSGDALHRRGYRTGVLEGGAPLKETLAASMLLLSKWSPDRPLLDPFCGSGTILLEAALMAHNMAPGLRRRFAAEDWPLVCNAVDWEAVRAEAEERVVTAPKGVQIFGADIDRRAVEMTYEHLRAAGLEGSVRLSVADIHRLPPPPGEYGCIVTNPPYGERLGGAATANEGIGKMMRTLHERDWSLFALSGDATFEEQVGRMSSKRRKLYNGKLPCQFFQYFGAMPRRRERPPAAPSASLAAAAQAELPFKDEARGDGGSDRPGDWHCPKCKTLVFGSKGACFQCGYEKRNDWACPACLSLVFASKSACFKCGHQRGSAEASGGDGGRGGSGSGGGGGGGGGKAARMGGRGGIRRGMDDMTVLFLSKGRLWHTKGASSAARVVERATWSGMTRLMAESAGVNGGGGEIDGWDPESNEWARIGSWVCMKNCGACCFLGASEAPDAAPHIAEQLRDMTGSDGWCKFFDKESRSCSIHETKPAFCRTSADSFAALYGVPHEEFEVTARSSCCEAIGDVYGVESLELARYKHTAGGEDFPPLSDLFV